MFLAYGLLASERDVGHLLGVNIISLQSYASRFEEALALADFVDDRRKAFDFSSPQHRQFIRWKFIAVESSAIATFNAFEALRQIAELYPKSETISKNIDESRFLKARQIFENNFPAMEKSVRTGIAHGAPAHESLKENRKHLPDGGPTIANMLTDRTLQSTLHGGVKTFTLSNENSAALNEVARLTDQAFAPAREFTLRYNSVDQYDKNNPIIVPARHADPDAA